MGRSTVHRSACTGPSFPGPEGGAGYFYPSSQTNIAADTTGHLAVALFQDVEPRYDGVVGPLQLASHTVDYYGNLSSTNNGASMPVPDVYPTSLSIPAQGNLLAVGSNAAVPWFNTPMSSGLQVFHFNGASLSLNTRQSLLQPPSTVSRGTNRTTYLRSASPGKNFMCIRSRLQPSCRRPARLTQSAAPRLFSSNRSEHGRASSFPL